MPVTRLSVLTACTLWLLPLACGPGNQSETLTPVATQLHLHGPGSEGTGSIRAGNRRAADLGIDVLFWTDHDFRISYWSFVNGWDFEAPNDQLSQNRTLPLTPEGTPMLKLTYALTPSRDNGSVAATTARLTDTRATEGRRSFQLTARGGGAAFQPLYYDFNVTRKRMHRSLLADVRLKIAVYPEIEERALPAVRVQLSQHFEDYKVQELRYVLWNGTPESLPVQAEPHVTYVPLAYKSDTWNRYELNVSQDAVTYQRGGLDNALNMVSFGMEVGAGAGTVYFDDYRIIHQYSGKALQQRILKTAQSIGREYGVTNYVGQEISYGRHVNTWGSWIPMVDYASYPGGMSYNEAVDFAHANRSIAAINHYVGGPPRNGPQDSATVAAFFNRKAQELESARVWNADCLEQRSGIDNQRLHGYLRVWDRLCRNGIIVTGNGTSDAHASGTFGWTEGDNLITWILARSPNERDLVDGLQRGAAYFGDPALFKGTVVLETDDGHVMGQATAKPAHTVHFKLTGLPLNGTVNIVENGEVTHRFPIDQTTLEQRVEISTDHRTCVRLGVWNAEGRGILFTNPVYFVPPADAGTVPACRLVRCES